MPQRKANFSVDRKRQYQRRVKGKSSEAARSKASEEKGTKQEGRKRKNGPGGVRSSCPEKGRSQATMSERSSSALKGLQNRYLPIEARAEGERTEIKHTDHAAG